MSEDGILQTISDNLPEILLLAAGIMAVLIVISYLKDKESALYKVVMVLGLLLGVGVIYESLTIGTEWNTFTRAVLLVAGFTLVVRPFRNVDFALFLGLIAAGITYVYLGGLTGDLAGLSHGYIRIILALVAGGFVYMLFNFIQKLAMLLGKILNCWPFLLIMGALCIVEAVLMLTDNGSIGDIYRDWRDAGSVIAALSASI